MKHLLRAARKHVEKLGLESDEVSRLVRDAFLAGSRWQAKMDAELAAERIRNHNGRAAQLAAEVSNGILGSVE